MTAVLGAPILGFTAGWGSPAASHAAALSNTATYALAGAAALVLVVLALFVGRRFGRRAIAQRLTALGSRLGIDAPQDDSNIERALSYLEQVTGAATEAVADASADAIRLRRSLDTLPQGVVICNESGAVVYRNTRANALMTSRRGDALAAQAVTELLEDAWDHGAAERTLDLYGPPRRTLSVQANLIDDGRRALGVIAMIDDVSERRRLEEIRRDFVANVSHELKTPMGALGLLAETLVTEPDMEVSRRLASRIQTEAFRVSRIIDDLLDLSRIESEEAPPREPVLVSLVMAEAVERVRATADQRGIEIELTEPDPPVAVLGDRRQLVSAMHALLENAVTYSYDGSTVAVSARVAQTDEVARNGARPSAATARGGTGPTDRPAVVSTNRVAGSAETNGTAAHAAPPPPAVETPPSHPAHAAPSAVPAWPLHAAVEGAGRAGPGAGGPGAGGPGTGEPGADEPGAAAPAEGEQADSGTAAAVPATSEVIVAEPVPPEAPSTSGNGVAAHAAGDTPVRLRVLPGGAVEEGDVPAGGAAPVPPGPTATPAGSPAVPAVPAGSVGSAATEAPTPPEPSVPAGDAAGEGGGVTAPATGAATTPVGAADERAVPGQPPTGPTEDERADAPTPATSVPAHAPRDMVRVTVSDHGVGIPARDLDRIFERFYRVDHGRSRDTGGTGLGLSIVRHVANNHQGWVEVESREGEGSAFTLVLPLQPDRRS